MVDRPRDLPRRAFLARARPAVAGAGLLVAGCNNGDEASDEGDPGLLNLLLTIEHAAADLYRRGLDADLASGRDRTLLETVAQHERDHVQVLRIAIEDLGGIPVEEPRLDHPDGLFSDLDRFLERAVRLEELQVAAYQGRMLDIVGADAFEIVASIAGTESRHAAVLARIAGRGPFPASVERSASEGAVRDEIASFVEG